MDHQAVPASQDVPASPDVPASQDVPTPQGDTMEQDVSVSQEDTMEPITIPSKEMLHTNTIINELERMVLENLNLVKDMATKLSSANLVKEQLTHKCAHAFDMSTKWYALYKKEKKEKDLALEKLLKYEGQDACMTPTPEEEDISLNQSSECTAIQEDSEEIHPENDSSLHVQVPNTKTEPPKEKEYEDQMAKLEKENNNLKQEISQFRLEKITECKCKRVSKEEIEVAKLDQVRLERLVTMTKDSCCDLRNKLGYEQLQDKIGVQATGDDQKVVTTIEEPEGNIVQQPVTDPCPFSRADMDYSRWTETTCKNDDFFYCKSPPPQWFPDEPRAHVCSQIRKYSRRSLKNTKGPPVDKQPLKSSKSVPGECSC